MPDLKRFCFALDLKEDETLIAEYECYHRQVWPEVMESIRLSGIRNMEIYRWANRLFMIMEVDKTFSFDKKARIDAASEKVQEWEKLMWKYQQALPGAKPGEKWLLMEQIFKMPDV